MHGVSADRHGTAVKSRSIGAMTEQAHATFPYRFKVVASLREPAYPGGQTTTFASPAPEANRP